MVYVESDCNLMAPLCAGSLLAAYCGSVGVTARAVGGSEYVSTVICLLTSLRHFHTCNPTSAMRLHKL